MGKFLDSWEALTDNVRVCTLLQKEVNYVPLFVVAHSMENSDNAVFCF